MALILQHAPRAANKWHLDEVGISIRSVTHWLWSAIDDHGDVPDILLQPRRNATAAKRSLKRLIAQFGAPRVVVTVKLRSDTRPIRALVPNDDTGSGYSATIRVRSARQSG